MPPSSPPDLPGSLTAIPHLMQLANIAQCIHAVPETLVPVHHQLAVACQHLQRFTFKFNVVSSYVIQHSRLQNEESAVDPPGFDLRFFGKGRHHVIFGGQPTETGWWTDRRHSSQPAV